MTRRSTKSKGNGNGFTPHFLKTKASYNLAPDTTYELELYSLATGRDKKEILEAAFAVYSKQYPISKKLREATELVWNSRNQT